MYSMPNDMYCGKLKDGMEERFPYHVYLSAAEPGSIDMTIYFSPEEIIAWLAQNVEDDAYEFRKNIDAWPEDAGPFYRPPVRPVYCFKRELDAILFKVRWVGADD